MYKQLIINRLVLEQSVSLDAIFINIFSLQIAEVENEDMNEDKKDSVVEVMKMNAPEWPQILVGCIGAIVMGCSMPVFAVLFGSILGVSIIIS